MPLTCSRGAARGGDVVQHRRRHGAEVDDVEPGRGQAADQRRRQRRPREPAVAADGHGRSPAAIASLPKARPRCSANFLVEPGADDAADVVGLEDRGGDLHVALLVVCRGILRIVTA
jgi:hypothetical protein